MAKHKKKKKKSSLNKVLFFIAALMLIVVIVLMLPKKGGDVAAKPTSVPELTATPEPTAEQTSEPTPEPTATPEPTPTPTPEPVKIVLTACGDCTLGGDMNGSSMGRFREYVSDADGNVDYGYCFRNVKSIFEEDDITLANLEVVLTDRDDYLQREDKIFIMRGQPDYVNMLTENSIEVCNIANNHMTDFGQSGIDQMAQLLDDNGIGSCGYGYSYVTEVKGVTLGFVGINYWTTEEDDFRSQLTAMREKCDIMIVSMHWGNELEYYPLEYQQKWGRIAVDLGADVVIGHHPHVLEGIEQYNGVNIVYSLGNFCFGGKANPDDKDTFIYRTTFTVDHTGRLTDTEYEIIPCKITSVKDDSSNNYQPTPITDKEDQVRLLKKIEKYSQQLSSPLKLTD